MNSDFNDEQIEVYASAFRAGDAIKVDGDWHKVELEDAYPDNKKSHTVHVIGNYHVVNNINDLGGCTGVTHGFREDEEIVEFPYQITTLEDYRLRGGEKLVRLGESGIGITFGKVYRTVNVNGGVDIIDDDGDNHRPLDDSRWGVIPRFKQVEEKPSTESSIERKLYERYYESLNILIKEELQSLVKRGNYKELIELAKLAIEAKEKRK